MNFSIAATDGLARRGTLCLPHGIVETPVFKHSAQRARDPLRCPQELPFVAEPRGHGRRDDEIVSQELVSM